MLQRAEERGLEPVCAQNFVMPEGEWPAGCFVSNTDGKVRALGRDVPLSDPVVSQRCGP